MEGVFASEKGGTQESSTVARAAAALAGEREEEREGRYHEQGQICLHLIALVVHEPLDGPHDDAQHTGSFGISHGVAGLLLAKMKKPTRPPPPHTHAHRGHTDTRNSGTIGGQRCGVLNPLCAPPAKNSTALHLSGGRALVRAR